MRKISFTEACKRFTNRYTCQHVPLWTKVAAPNGKFYAPQFSSDVEWYENTKFYGEPGHIGTKNECYTSNQTWPHGQWLDKPFNS